MLRMMVSVIADNREQIAATLETLAHQVRDRARYPEVGCYVAPGTTFTIWDDSAPLPWVSATTGETQVYGPARSRAR